MIRIGQGYDTHRIQAGKGLKLGGVSFPEAKFKLEGHSDADVIIHAACDALLGAAGLRDIGTLFPDTAKANKNRNSLEFLELVGQELKKRQVAINNLDCTLIAELPKIASKVPLMCKRMAKALGINPEQIAVKATTNERCGFIGRQEGMAAMAIALVQQK